MEALLMGLKTQLDQQAEQLRGVTETLKELKMENSTLRKEILGVGTSASSSEESMGLLENKTLRGLVEEIQFQVNALNAKYTKNKNRKIGPFKRNVIPKRMQPVCTSEENESNESTDAGDDMKDTFPVVEIVCKTIEEERKWMKLKFNELVKDKAVTAGVSHLKTELLSKPTSCKINVSNFLNYALTDPVFYIWRGKIINGLSRVIGNVSEIICIESEPHPTSNDCYFMCSFRLCSGLRLLIYCNNYHPHGNRFGIGFTPEGVSVDQKLYEKFSTMTSLPDLWMSPTTKGHYSKESIELFVTLGNLVARGHMTPGPHSQVDIQILELDVSRTVFASKKSIVDELSWDDIPLSKVSCKIDIANCLNVTLKTRSRFYCKNSQDYFMPSEIRPFHRAGFFAASDPNLEAMFSYEIESTDLCFVLALRVEPNHNSFAAAFVQVPAVTDANGFRSFMSQDADCWESHTYRKYARAEDGEQVIRIRNIQAKVSMTVEEISKLKIRIFAL